MDKIYITNKSTSYGDFGHDYNISFHRTEEGAYLKLDELAEEYGILTQHTCYDGTYYYSDDNETLLVKEVILYD